MQQSRFSPAGRALVVLAMTAALMLAGCQREPERQDAAAKPGLVSQAEPSTAESEQRTPPDLPPLFHDIEKRTFQFFWETTSARNGLAPDRHPSRPFASIAAVGFALTAYPIGVENGWISRAQAAERTLATLRFFHEAKQGPQAQGISGYKGFFYHFLDMDSGHRWNQGVELSTVDTTLLLGGVLFAQGYYDGDDPRERKIRELADTIYRRVDWTWAQNNKPLVSMGWHPERGFIPSDWRGYNEAMLLYVLALGSPTHPVGPEAWEAWTSTYDKDWGTFQGQEYLSFAPHFGHQYSHVWIDFRGIRDAYMKERGIDYFENSRRATYAQRAYAIENPMGWEGYGENIWGLTACDGPAGTIQPYKDEQRQFRQYSARGAGLSDAFDDGTIAPTAAIASLPFAPEIVIPAAEAMVERYGESLYAEYGFLDAFNPSFDYDLPSKTGRMMPGGGWVANDYLGIDQGPIVAMIANYRNDFVWNVMKRSPYIRAGLKRAGFTGGWLAGPEAPKTSAAPEAESAAAQANGAAQSEAATEAPPESPPRDSEPPM